MPLRHDLLFLWLEATIPSWGGCIVRNDIDEDAIKHDVLFWRAMRY